MPKEERGIIIPFEDYIHKLKICYYGELVHKENSDINSNIVTIGEYLKNVGDIYMSNIVNKALSFDS